MIDLSSSLLNRIGAQFGPVPPTRLGVGVSGGSDSLALLMLLHEWSQMHGNQIFAATVDHQLRVEAKDEAADVARICHELQIPHETLVWTDWNHQGNLPDQARRARYRLLAEWAHRNNLNCVAVGHTINDQAETFLMRLSREAGVDGLAAMRTRWRDHGTEFCRPVLSTGRGELRAYLRGKNLDWVEDPSNYDTEFERVRARKVLETLGDLGVTPRTLATVADHLAEVRTSLYWYVFLAAQKHVCLCNGDVYIARKGFRTLPSEVCRRMIQEVLKWISGAGYGPRGRSLDLLLESIRGGTGMTLHGCVMNVTDEQIHFTREPKAVEDLVCPASEPWDNRWKLDGPWQEGAIISSLGKKGLLQCENWRDTNMIEAALHASPAVWRNGQLLAAPLAGHSNGWTATLLRDEQQFYAAILAH